MTVIGTLYQCVPDIAIRAVSQPLPKRVGVYNGVAVRDIPFFAKHDRQPHKKRILWKATRDALTPGDTVTFVGGGKGIVPIKTAQRGHDVTVIEGAKELALDLEQTAGLNSITMQVRHGVVGSPENVWGDSSDATNIHPKSLHSDIIVLDCEGAETSILPLPEIETVVVESHPMHGVTETELRQIMHGEITSMYRNSHGGQVLVRQ